MIPVEHSSRTQTVTLSANAFTRNKKTMILSNSIKMNRMKEVLVELIPNDNQSNGTQLTFLRVIAIVSDELKTSIREKREFCKINIFTEITNKQNGHIIVPHTHHNPIDMGEDGQLAHFWVLMDSKEMKNWNAKYFEYLSRSFWKCTLH